MKISNSKKQLAQLLVEAGVTQFPEGANWAAQDKGGTVCIYAVKPKRDVGDDYWDCKDGKACSMYRYYAESPIPNWHQTALSRDEFDQIVAESVEQSKPDANGWIEWKGGECPVGEDDLIDVKFSDGDSVFGVDSDWDWSYDADICNIIAYRLHKPEIKPEFCESVTRSIPEPEAKPTIEQLAQDYRNAKDYADRLQKEAGEAAVKAEEFAVEIRKKILELQELIGIPNTEKEPELVITNWRDLRVDDLIWYGGDDQLSYGEYHVMEIETPDYEGYRTVLVNGDSGGHWIDTRVGWGFIRRP